jgi:hypothetical protein
MMAKVKDNILLKGLSGTIGQTLTLRQIGGETFVSKYQKAPTVAATEKKLAARAKFGRATAYARKAVKDPELKAMYQVKVNGGQRAFNIAMMDALRAPVIENIKADSYQGRPGDQIFIRATDDFKVANVEVSVYNPEGELLEQGNADMQQNEVMQWVYVVRQDNPEFSGSKITAVATDLPGNSSSLRIIVL